MRNRFRHEPIGRLAEPLDGLQAPSVAATNPLAAEAAAPAAPPCGKSLKRDWLAEALSCHCERDERR